MASCSADEEKWKLSYASQQAEEQEEEEALSLCDLPVNLIEEDNNEARKDQETENHQEDFDFNGPGGGDGRSLSPKSEMCAADDIFFQGQILPLRLSVSSEAGLNKFKLDNSLNPSRCVSRSESMDHSSLGGFTSFSSRSSSTRSSHYSSSSTAASSAAATTATRISKPRIQKSQFHYNHPSPKPQIRLSSASLGNTNRNRNSSVWEFLRLGLVRTPEIELQDLKARNSVSRNSSSSSSNSNFSLKNSSKGNGGGAQVIINNTVTSQGKNTEKQSKQKFLEIGGGLLSGCSCSVGAVKPVPLNIVVKSKNSTGNGNDEKSHERGSMEEKPQEVKVKKRTVQKQQQQQRRHATSRHRTFEWIKELSHSHATFVDDREA